MPKLVQRVGLFAYENNVQTVTDIVQNEPCVEIESVNIEDSPDVFRKATFTFICYECSFDLEHWLNKNFNPDYIDRKADREAYGLGGIPTDILLAEVEHRNRLLSIK